MPDILLFKIFFKLIFISSAPETNQKWGFHCKPEECPNSDDWKMQKMIYKCRKLRDGGKG
jgi:hypothetical protein